MTLVIDLDNKIIGGSAKVKDIKEHGLILASTYPEEIEVQNDDSLHEELRRNKKRGSWF